MRAVLAACKGKRPVAAALTDVSSSLLDSLRLQNSEQRFTGKDRENLVFDWTDVPRPERDRSPLATAAFHPSFPNRLIGH